MTFRDITVMKNPLDRATAYAQKIQELSVCDTGLSEWLKAMQQKGACRSVWSSISAKV
jgi:hypothetical protein